MKKRLIRVFPCALVIALLFACFQLVSAASISGDVAPSGVVDMADYMSESVELPDRTRLSFLFVQPSDNYYFASKGVSSSNSIIPYGTDYISKSYDTGSSQVVLGGVVSGDKSYYYAHIYPIGRNFYKLPYSSDLISNTDSTFSVWMNVRTCKCSFVSGSGYTYSYSAGLPYKPEFCFLFYDLNFNLISSERYDCSASYISGSASEDSYTLYKYSSSFSIPDGSVYVVPCVRIRNFPASYSTSSFSYLDANVSSAGMSCSFCFDVMNDDLSVDGVWEFNDVLSYSYSVQQDVSFTCSGVSYNNMVYSPTGSLTVLKYGHEEDIETVYVDQWYLDRKKTIDFGSASQSVSASYYSFLTANAVRVSDSAETEVFGDVLIKDYGGGIICGEIEGIKFPCIVSVNELGIGFTSDGSDEPNATYSFEGTGSFIGVSTVANASVTTYSVGTSFIMFSPGSIYLHVDGDTGSITSPVTGWIDIYDYSGSVELFKIDDLQMPCTVNVVSDGLEFYAPDSTTPEYTYEFSGTGKFVGVNVWASAAALHYPIGSTFEISGNIPLYLVVEGNITGGDDAGSGDDSDSGTTDSTAPTINDLEEEKNQASSSGNSSVDDMMDVIPDYSEGFIDSLGNLVDAFSYEGTSCALMIPAITIPAVSNLIPETELYPASVYNVESLFALFPDNIILLVRSLLTIGLIIYCFKELYDTISYFLTLKKGEN